MSNTTFTKMNKDPPAYHRSFPSEEEAEAIEAKWEESRPKDFDCHCETPCKVRCREKVVENVFFGLQPPILQSMSLQRLFRNRKAQPAWRALMVFVAGNVAALMRHGFFWSPENLDWWTQSVSLDNRRDQPWLSKTFSSQWGWTCRDKRWKYRRYYRIKKQPSCPKWIGTLMVFAKDASTVTNFDISWVDIDTVVWEFAKDWEGRLVYDTWRGPNDSFNTVLPGMPLKGWWPWPKTKGYQP